MFMKIYSATTTLSNDGFPSDSNGLVLLSEAPTVLMIDAVSHCERTDASVFTEHT
jgi:hypothetical protein